ncbi:MAG: YkgJ family cysteine cluster protein [Ferruginibacter sp.]|nr:YkgJ family cysteine cluster protein [Ferruginibacter sp.]
MSSNLMKNWQKKSVERKKLYKQFLERTDKNKVLPFMSEIHESAFQKINCLDCAACCTNYSPRFKTPDIKRISRYLTMKEGVFIETYLNIDEDGDYVLKSKPCPFLRQDNQCSIYDVRPSDCARFPYTDEDVLLKRPQLTLKNAEFCPIVYFTLERLIEIRNK